MMLLAIIFSSIFIGIYSQSTYTVRTCTLSTDKSLLQIYYNVVTKYMQQLNEFEI